MINIKIIKKMVTSFIISILMRVRYFLTWDPWIRSSYSQEGEDMVLRKIFKNQNNGFYVDVGAHHPKRFSNTYLLYKKGWKGINIDATPGSMKLFNKLRQRDINLELGVALKETFLDYHIFNEPALNSFSMQLSEKRNQIKNEYFIKEIIKVDAKPLSKILDIYLKGRKIDILNIDVEGMDLDVLNSNDWSKYRPKFVVIEILKNNLHEIDKEPIFQLMKKQNYVIFSKQINTVFFKDCI